jgi:predicted small secreted protein
MKLQIITKLALAALVSTSLLTTACGGDDGDGEDGDETSSDSSDGSSDSGNTTSDGNTNNEGGNQSSAPSKKALGDSCSEAAECEDGICITYDGGGFCTRQCTSASDCPEEGWDCNISPYTACVPAS